MTDQPTRGVTDARIHLMREADRAGQLDPAIAAVLDRYDPAWRTNPLDAAWEDVLREYRAWTRRNKRVPRHGDEGAAGLLTWLMAQSRDRDLLPVSKLRKLETLIGWDTLVLRKNKNDHAWAVMRGLSEAGTVPRRRGERRVIEYMLRSTESRRTWRLRAAEGYWEQDWLLTVTLFRLRHQRFPTPREPGGRWLQQVRQRAEVNGWLDAGLDQLGKWR